MLTLWLKEAQKVHFLFITATQAHIITTFLRVKQNSSPKLRVSMFSAKTQ